MSLNKNGLKIAAAIVAIEHLGKMSEEAKRDNAYGTVFAVVFALISVVCAPVGMLLFSVFFVLFFLRLGLIVLGFIGHSFGVVASDIATHNMTTVWYYMDGTTRVGPVSQAQLDSAVRSGRIKRNTMVWRHSDEGWRKAGDIPETGVR